MADDETSREAAENRRYYLEIALAALTTVENVLSEHTPEVKENIRLLEHEYGREELAQGAMIVLTALVSHAEDSSGLPASQQVQSLRELMLATLDED